MHIVALAWMFVVLLMSLVEATSPDGTLLGAIITFLLYGVLPVSIVLYVLATPMRRRRRRRQEQQQAQAAAVADGLSESRSPPRDDP
jgi:membrane protein implicated in regulation of membrane protease activity